MTSVVLVALISLVAALQCLYWWKVRKHAAAVVGAVFVVVYFVDLVVIALQRSITLTVSIRDGAFEISEWHSAVVLSTGVWLVYTLGISMIRVKRAYKSNYESPSKNHRVSLTAYIGLSSIAVVGIVVPVLETGIVEALSLRQQVFGDGILGLVGYFLAPVLFVFGVVILQFHAGPARVVVSGFIILNLAATFLTGSRTGLFLTAIVPVLLYIWRSIASRDKGISSDLKRIVLMAAAFAIPVVGGSWYLSKTRGVVSDDSGRSAFNSVDISQADVLIALIQNRSAGHTQTYLGSLATFIPREWWPEKPVSGNAVTSQILAPDRYQMTNSEVTAGVVGEAFINLGLFAPLAAGVILVLFVMFSGRLLENSNDVVWILGVVIVMRGLNLVRGDMANIVTPTLLAVLAWILIFGIGSRPRTPLGASGSRLLTQRDVMN